MGNTLVTSDYDSEFDDPFTQEDLTGATFDFISTVGNNTNINNKRNESTLPTQIESVPEEEDNEEMIQLRSLYTPAQKMVAVMPVLGGLGTARLPPGRFDTKVTPDMSFNDRLNMINWDPEGIPSCENRQEIYVFQPPDTINACQSHNRENLSTQRPTEKKSIPKWSLLMLQKRLSRHELENQNHEILSRKGSSSNVNSAKLSDTSSEYDDEISFSSDQEQLLLLHQPEQEEVDTPNASVESIYYAKDEKKNSIDPQDSPTDSESEIEDEEDESNFFSSSQAFCVHWKQYWQSNITKDDTMHGIYQEIEIIVNNSTCWMNEHERITLIRILQACASYHEMEKFNRHLMFMAEEYLIGFQGNEDAAFNALVLLARS